MSDQNPPAGYPHLYTLEQLPDGKVVVQHTHDGVTQPTQTFNDGDAAIAHVQQLLHAQASAKRQVQQTAATV